MNTDICMYIYIIDEFTSAASTVVRYDLQSSIHVHRQHYATVRFYEYQTH